MSNVIRKIFLDEAGENDQEVHEAFIKFGKGEFGARYLLEGKKQKDRWAIKTSAEFGNYFVKRCLADVEEPIDMKGVIVFMIFSISTVTSAFILSSVVPVLQPIK